MTVNAPDANTIFKSSDDIIFRIHRNNLETSAGSFPSSGTVHREGDIVELTEDAPTLELLFQFVYPRRHPTLRAFSVEQTLDTDTIHFSLLERVAEAAEKYEVFAAMNICYIRMEEALPTYPVQVLNYAAKRGYKTLVARAPPYLLDMSVEFVVPFLSGNIVVPWILFRSRWNTVVTTFLWTPIDGTQYVTTPDQRKTCKFGCVHGGGLIANLWLTLGERRSRAAILSAYQQLKPPCLHIIIDIKEITERLDVELAKLDSFSV
ncbi:hypothetical protein H0H93_009113 [Arthromyces matolae]|nr:hypothetical protein H0H93_009113 [Arthromyces matolae]